MKRNLEDDRRALYVSTGSSELILGVFGSQKYFYKGLGYEGENIEN
jgi:hypothetical protein